MIIQASTPPHVVIIGGGFGGIKAVKALKGANVNITLIDRHNYHLFQPLLYQVAMAGLSPAEIAYPIRSIFSKQKNVEVLLAEVTAIDLKNQTVQFTNGQASYDYLVIASGAQTAYFGHPEWEKYTLGLKDIRDSLKMRERILLAFEEAETNPEKQKELLTFVIIGGGPTGVELAGQLAEMAMHALSKDFRHIQPESARIILLEGMNRLLLALPEHLSAKAKQKLEALGVEVRTNTMVKDITRDGVVLANDFIQSSTILWCAGIAATPLAKTLEGIELDKGRIPVEPDLSIKGHPNVFAIGDACVFLHQDDSKPLPGLAPVAMQQGTAVGKNIRHSLSGKPRKKFRYVHRGSLAIIGRSAAVGDINGINVTGFIAWLTWLFIHIYNLIDFRSRFVVMFDWLVSFLTYKRGARLITGNKLQAGPPGDQEVETNT